MVKQKQKFRLILYFIIFIVLGVIHGLGQVQTYFIWTSIMSNIVHSLQAIVVAFAILETIFQFVKKPRIQHIIRSVIFFVTALVIFFIFQDQLVAISISLGILAGLLILTFQSAILSLVGWIYLRTANIFREGDRIRVNDVKGNVIDISLLNTKIVEVGGEYVANDLPSGRFYMIPNSVFLSQPVANYSKEFPYVWTDIPFHLTYETDFPFVISEIEKIISKYLRGKKNKMAEQFKRFQEKYGFREEKFVPTHYNYSAMHSFIEFRVTFPVEPKRQSVVVTELTQKILEMFNKNPEKVRFPKGRAR